MDESTIRYISWYGHYINNCVQSPCVEVVQVSTCAVCASEEGRKGQDMSEHVRCITRRVWDMLHGCIQQQQGMGMM